MYQFNIVFGILIAFLSNYLLSGSGENDWRWMLGVEAIPAVLYILFALKLPKSPRWLLSKNKIEEAKKVLAIINPDIDVEQQLKSIDGRNKKPDTSETIFIKKYRFPLVLAFLFAFFNQFSGINAFLYYAPRIFGSIGYIISLSLVAMAFFLNWSGMAVPIFLFLFIAAHAVGQGAVIWVFISEIFPNHLRALGQSFGSTTHWVLAALIPSLIPYLFSHPEIGAGVGFLFFAAMMVLQLLFVAFMMPETKGKTLEELEELMLNKK